MNYSLDLFTGTTSRERQATACDDRGGDSERPREPGRWQGLAFWGPTP